MGPIPLPRYLLRWHLLAVPEMSQAGLQVRAPTSRARFFELVANIGNPVWQDTGFWGTGLGIPALCLSVVVYVPNIIAGLIRYSRA